MSGRKIAERDCSSYPRHVRQLRTLPYLDRRGSYLYELVQEACTSSLVQACTSSDKRVTRLLVLVHAEEGQYPALQDLARRGLPASRFRDDRRPTPRHRQDPSTSCSASLSKTTARSTTSSSTSTSPKSLAGTSRSSRPRRWSSLPSPRSRLFSGSAQRASRMTRCTPCQQLQLRRRRTRRRAAG